MRVAVVNTPPGYETSLVPTIIELVSGEKNEFVGESRAELVIFGPFGPRKRKRRRLVRKFVRAFGRTSALRLFQTGENIRHDYVPADYTLSFDLGVNSDRHFRLPLWMECIDWSHELIIHDQTVRYAKRLGLDELMRPLGREVLKRPQRVSMFTSHLREPRRSLMAACSRIMPFDGYGRVFDRSIRNHNLSGIDKFEVLQGYRFNLCPENGLYPGYYTEKVVEAFGAGCIPITWADQNIACDFNPKAVVNSLDFASVGYYEGISAALSEENVRAACDEPLLVRRPELGPLISFLETVVSEARQ
jgi:Glycosyltransferase family 10 (fucosyltransferase) C-term/Alpha-(1,3)-fucosyltransferase FucT N-terminal domain